MMPKQKHNPFHCLQKQMFLFDMLIKNKENREDDSPTRITFLCGSLQGILWLSAPIRADPLGKEYPRELCKYFVVVVAVSSFSVGILFHESPLCALAEEVSQLDGLRFASALALQNS